MKEKNDIHSTYFFSINELQILEYRVKYTCVDLRRLDGRDHF